MLTEHNSSFENKKHLTCYCFLEEVLGTIISNKIKGFLPNSSSVQLNTLFFPPPCISLLFQLNCVKSGDPSTKVITIIIYLVICEFLYRCLPPIPKAIICIPFIKSAIEIMRPNSTTPNDIGCAITRSDTAILNTPTPAIKPLDHPGASLFLIPCTILAIPTNINEIAAKVIKKPAVNTGNDMTTRATAMAITPRPILAIRDDLLGNGAIPVAILSIPIISKAMESIRIIVYTAIPGNARITIDSIIEIAPKPTCIYRSQLGDFCLLLLGGDFTEVIHLVLE
jgi:hypothetical protein